MLTDEGRQRLVAGAMFALPLAAVLIAPRALGPAAVQAGTAPAVAPVAAALLPHAAPVPPTEDQVRAEAWIERLAAEPFGPTPLLHLESAEEPVVAPPSESEATEDAPEFKVTSILVSSQGNRAIIDGVIRREGDTLGDTGWLITLIDGVARSVTIFDPQTARSSTRFVRAPDFQ